MSPGYTIVQHEILDSEAARLFSPTARALLLDFIRKWSLATAGGRTPAAIPFTWVSCSWVIARNTWIKARAELVAKNFLSAVHLKAGLFAWSDSWRTYQPTLTEVARLEKQRLAQQGRADSTKARRAQNPGLTIGRKIEALPPETDGGGRAQDLGHTPQESVAQDLRHTQGTDFAPHIGRKIDTLLITELHKNAYRSPYSPPSGKPGKTVSELIGGFKSNGDLAKRACKVAGVDVKTWGPWFNSVIESLEQRGGDGGEFERAVKYAEDCGDPVIRRAKDLGELKRPLGYLIKKITTACKIVKCGWPAFPGQRKAAAL